MKQWKRAVASLILAALLSVLPTAMAASPESSPVRGCLSTPDFTMLRWYAETAEERIESEGSTEGSISLTVTAAPGTTWTLGATYTRVRDDQLLPYMGNEDVSGYCAWESDTLQLDGATVTLPREAGTYALSGTFGDDEGNAFACEIVFNVTEEYFDVARDPAYEAGTDTATTVEEKVAQIVAECRQQGFAEDDQYHIALWLHDWLIYHASYDYTYSNYNADGVLLRGKGVCDSYTKAYALLLDEFGIENMRVVGHVVGAVRGHAWNLVKIDGTWCHVDCTWDDHGVVAAETHLYFGMSDGAMGRDHQWDEGDYPAATSMANYYYIREGYLCFSTDEELDAILTEQASNQVHSFTLLYTGSDANVNAHSATLNWLRQYDWKYGVNQCTINIAHSSCDCDIFFGYTDPWEDPGISLPVDAPDFNLWSPRGNYQLKNYADNGILLIFGTKGDLVDQEYFLERLSSQIEGLYGKGVEVLVSLSGASGPEDLADIEAKYPGYHYTYGDTNIARSYLEAVGYHSGLNPLDPYVFVIDRNARITYCATDTIRNLDDLLAAVNAVATNNPLPEPELVKRQDVSDMLNGTGNVNDITDGGVLVSAVQAAAEKGNVLLVMEDMSLVTMNQLKYAEKHWGLLEALACSVISANIYVSDTFMANYPHCAFVDLPSADYWHLLRAAGYTETSPTYKKVNMFIQKGGDIAAYAYDDTLSIAKCMAYAAQIAEFDAAIPASLTEIEAEAFRNTDFNHLDLDNGSLKTIRSGAFTGNGAPTLVRIPDSVTLIEDGAFDDDTVIICVTGSTASAYAESHGLEYVCE